jgi:hypothetical protein
MIAEPGGPTPALECRLIPAPVAGIQFSRFAPTEGHTRIKSRHGRALLCRGGMTDELGPTASQQNPSDAENR